MLNLQREVDGLPWREATWMPLREEFVQLALQAGVNRRERPNSETGSKEFRDSLRFLGRSLLLDLRPQVTQSSLFHAWIFLMPSLASFAGEGQGEGPLTIPNRARRSAAR